MTKPKQDLREVFNATEEQHDGHPGRVPEFDARWLEGVGVELDPWRFDQTPPLQKIRCRIGLHRGRMESLGGEVCFYCSYCGEIVR